MAAVLPVLHRFPGGDHDRRPRYFLPHKFLLNLNRLLLLHLYFNIKSVIKFIKPAITVTINRKATKIPINAIQPAILASF